MKQVTRALADAARQLEPTSDTARLDAELLMAEALHIDRDQLILSPPERNVPDRFWAMVDRRRAGEPVAYITGRRAFWNIELHVGPGVLVPRPDSEVLVASAIEHFDGTGGPRGSSISAPGPARCCWRRSISGPKRAASAIDVRARRCPTPPPMRGGSASRRGPKFKIGNWADGHRRAFDLILCNPPYIADGAELGPGVANMSPTRRCSPASTGSTPIARSARNFRDCLRKAGWRRSRSGWARRKR